MIKSKKSCCLLTAQSAKAIDLKAKKKFGISTLTLMENAGRAVALEALKSRRFKKIAVFCGKGNNGGDGFVAARHLLACGIKPDIYLAGKICQVENEAKTNLAILLKLKTKITEVSKNNFSRINLAQYGLIIDALLGVGLSGEMRGIYKDLIKLINYSKAHILSVDIPSGLEATTGKILGVCVKADKTVTFVAKKRGMIVGDGPKYCGKIVVADLGLPL
jgi:NAD(P)H-hydrate epimerase